MNLKKCSRNISFRNNFKLYTLKKFAFNTRTNFNLACAEKKAASEIGTNPNRYWKIGPIKAVPISMAFGTYLVGPKYLFCS